jgi:hypothetical protein
MVVIMNFDMMNKIVIHVTYCLVSIPVTDSQSALQVNSISEAWFEENS